ncbi:hypothetical protein A5881_002945 [Enterococcus termitis]|nr:hypothetical protein A5881_002400 [Enterococcus termitis]
MEEIWKPIQGYQGIYEVSSKGKVKTSVGKKTYSSLHGVRTWKPRILKLKTDKNGYKRVTLWKNKSGKDFLVHRLVANAFIELKEGKDYVNHIDGNPSNNYAENLEWVNHSENLIHAFENRLNKSPDPIVLYNTSTKEVKYFYSKAKASEFLGRGHGYLSGIMKNGERFVDEYEIFTNK